MKLHLTQLPETKMFTAHGSDYVRVNADRFDHNIVVRAEEVRQDWSAASFENLSEADFDYFLDLKPEVLLFGTGPRQRFAHPRLYRALIEARIAVEFMDTAAVCRTYNILVAEDRKVIAAILI